MSDDGDDFRRIPGVLHVRVVLGADGKPREIHVVTDTRKPPQYFVRDIEAVALAVYGWAIDRRIVSIAQLEGSDARDAAEVARTGTAAPEGPAPRPSLTAVTTTTGEGGVVVVVDLTIGESVMRGESRGPGSAAQRPRLVAEAALAALVELLGIPAYVVDAQVVQAADQRVAVSVLTLTIPMLGDQMLTGSALVRGDEEQALARSVLACVNRRLAG